MNAPGRSLALDPRRPTGRLAVRQAMVAAGVALALGILFAAVQVSLDYSESVAAEQQQMAQALVVLREPAAQAAYHLNKQAATAVVRAAVSFASVRQATLRNDFGETLAEGGNGGLADDSDAWWARFTDPIRTYSLPLQYGPGPRRVGELQIVTAQGPRVERFLHGVWRDFGLSVLRSLGVALALGVLFYATLTRPLSAIARRIRGGHGAAVGVPLAEAQRDDEIGEIASAFERFEREGRERTQRLETAAAALAASELRYRRIVETAGEGVWQVDTQGTTTLANEAMAQMLGTTASQLVGRSVFEFMDETGRPTGAELLRATLDGGAGRHEFRFRRVDGRELWAELSTCPITDAEGRAIGVLAMVTDATERRRRDEELRASNAQLRTTVGNLERQQQDMARIAELNELLQSARSEAEAFDVIGTVGERLFAGESGGLTIADADDELQRVCTWGAATCVPQRFTRDACWAIRRGAAHEQSRSHGVRCRHHGGAAADPVLCLPLYVEGQLLGVLHVVGDGAAGDADGDESRRRRTEIFGEVIKLGLSNLRLRESLREQALRDPLTGLPNRRLFDEALPRELALCARAAQPLTVAVVDVDRFKHFNDTYGHEVGDRVLRAVAKTLQGGIRSGDLACRYGGDEFLCLLVGATAADARARLQQLMDEHAVGSGRAPDALPEPVTFTIGLATAPDCATEAAALLRAADAALYAAKARGGHCIDVAVPLSV